MKPTEITVGYGPTSQPPPDFSKAGYHYQSWQQCRAYIGQLHRTFGAPPYGAKLVIAETTDKSGTWYRVVCRFESGDEQARAYALKLQQEPPDNWDAAAEAAFADGDGATLPPRRTIPEVPAATAEPEPVTLTAKQLDTLKRLYVRFGHGSDELLVKPELAKELADRFAQRARKQVPPAQLAAFIVAQRKRGGWPSVREPRRRHAGTNGAGPGKRAASSVRQLSSSKEGVRPRLKTLRHRATG